MDGKLKFLALSKIDANGLSDANMHAQRHHVDATESHYIETTWGVSAA